MLTIGAGLFDKKKCYRKVNIVARTPTGEYNKDMKQKVSVRAIIKHEGKTLLLRRNGGRASIRGKHELMGGTVKFGEQPDDALRQYAIDQLGVEISTLQIQDAVGYIDPDNDRIQYIIVVFMASIKKSSRIDLGDRYDRYLWKKLSEIQRSSLTSLTSMLLNYDREDAQQSMIVDKNTTKDTFIVYSDGGSRGNPGPSAAGYVVLNTSEEVLEEGGSYLGITTNNQAEYQAVLLGLSRVKELGAKRVDFRVDSMLIVNQMNGTYKVKNRDLWPIYERIKELISAFDKVSFQHVRREFNTHADSMVNKILDEHTQ